MSVEVNIQEMMETGAHFGHQTKRWNPRMRPYIYGSRSGVHIIDLQKTKDLANAALNFITEAVGRGDDILFVGTKVQSREIVKEQAARANMHYVNNRWMGGTLTNFQTIKKSIDKLIDYTDKRENDGFEGFTKRELLDVDRSITKLEASLGGIKRLKRQPDVVFIVDPTHEHIAVLEAKKLGIPVIALIDSNCDPDPIDYPIPSNDDAVSAIAYFTAKIADACLVGLDLRETNARAAEEQQAKLAKDKKPARRKRVTRGTESKDKGQKTAYVDRRGQPQPEEAAKEESKVEAFSAKVEEAEEKPVATEVTTENNSDAAADAPKKAQAAV